MITQNQVIIGKLYLFDNYLLVKANEYIPNHIDKIGAICDYKKGIYYTLDRLSLCHIEKDGRRVFRKASVFKSCYVKRNIRYLF